jgi:hypothetical protein
MRVMTTRYRVRLHSIDPRTAGLPDSPETDTGDDLERHCIADAPKTTPPLKAIRQHCLRCCNGSACREQERHTARGALRLDGVAC